MSKNVVERGAGSLILSVVVPVHNGEKFLTQLIGSIASQDFTDYEVIFVNDASTDRTGDILLEAPAFNPRIRFMVANCKNAGDARNLGLEKALGKYVLFLDADDFVAKNMFSKICSAAASNCADIVLFGGRRYDEVEKKLSEKREFVRADLAPSGVFSSIDAAQRLFQITTPCPWNKLFCREFLESNSLRFDSLGNAEDLSFSLGALALANRIVVLDEDYIRYRVNTGGGNAESRKIEQPLCFISALDNLETRLKENGLEEALLATFREQALSTTRYNIETVSSYESRVKIFEALSRNPFGILDCLNRDISWYSSRYAFECARFVSAALQQNRTQQLETEGASASMGEIVCVVGNSIEYDPLMSIIIPVYNGAKYIRETVQSVLSQTFQSIEIVCVDDGSEDDTLQVLEALAKEDERISVYSQQNCGLSISRNRGQKMSSGRYILFLDGDDLLRRDAIECIVAEAESKEADVVLFDSEPFYESVELESKKASYKTYYKRSKEYGQKSDGMSIVFEMEKNGDYLPSACFMAVRRQYLESLDLWFHPGIIHEDNAHTFELLINATCVTHIQENFYLRRVRDNSIMTREVSFANVYGYFACWVDMEKAAYAYALEAKLDRSDLERLLVIPNKVRNNACQNYAKLSSYEFGALKALPDSRLALFESSVAVPGRSMKKSLEVKGLKAKQKKTEKEVKSLKASNSYRVGRAVTAPVRLIKRIVKRQSFGPGKELS